MNEFGLVLFSINNQSSHTWHVGSSVWCISWKCLLVQKRANLTSLTVFSCVKHSVYSSAAHTQLSCFVFRSSKLSFKILLSQASVMLRDDITSPTGPVELLRLTLTKLLLSLGPAPSPLPPELAADPAMAASVSALVSDSSLVELYASSLQVDNQLYNRASFHFPVLLCQDQRGGTEPGALWSRDATESPEMLEEFKKSCFLQLKMVLAADGCTVEEVTFCLLFSFLLGHFNTHGLHHIALFHNGITCDNKIKQCQTTSKQECRAKRWL